MSDQDTQQEESIQPASPGSVLAEARNKQGLSIVEVAESLKITESYVKAIEESAFDVLPQSAFVRGYIRNYARLVGLSGEDLVKDFDLYIGNDGVDTPRLQGSKKVKPLRAHSAPSPVHALALLLVVSLGGLSYYLWNHRLDVEPNAAITSIEERPVEFDSSLQTSDMADSEVFREETLGVTEDLSSTPADSGVEEQPLQNAVEEVEEPEFPPIAVESAEVVDVTAEDELTKPVLESGKPLVIDFSEDCWVEIKDGSGKTLVSSVQIAGTSINLDVIPPVSVRFGNTPGVENILFDGKPVARPNSSTRVASVLLTGNSQG